MYNFNFFIHTFGCKVNQYESQSVRETWQSQGATDLNSPENADYILLNSCAITEHAVRELKQVCRRMAKIAPNAKIIIAGCAAQLELEELKQIPQLHKFVDQKDKEILLKPDFFDTDEISASKEAFPSFSISSFKRARPVVKVQDGCSQFCSYCIVPFTRGKPQSRPYAQVLAEIETLLENGYREIMFSGINLLQYSHDNNDFWDLMQKLDKALGTKWQGVARFRISSLDPSQLNDKSLEYISNAKLLCPHLHVSLQSGSKQVLKAMNRSHYDPNNLLKYFDELHKIWGSYGLGFDLLMGFLGETEEAFKESIEFVEKTPLSYGHVFPYSVRPGTSAARQKEINSLKVKQERAAKMRELVQEKQIEFLNKMLTQKSFKLALDLNNSKKSIKGISEYYVSCILKTAIENANHDFIEVKPLEIKNNSLLVELVK